MVHNGARGVLHQPPPPGRARVNCLLSNLKNIKGNGGRSIPTKEKIFEFPGYFRFCPVFRSVLSFDVLLFCNVSPCPARGLMHP